MGGCTATSVLPTPSLFPPALPHLASPALCDPPAAAAPPCSLGGAELHVVAAVMGGMAAQEAIKLLTKQFVPFAGSLVYNAMASTTTVLAL
jgi:hypothetical protein